MAKLDDLNKIIDTNLDKLDMSLKLKVKLRNEVKIKKKFNFKRLGYIGTPMAAAIIIFVALILGPFSANRPLKVNADNLMENIIPQKVKAVELKKEFLKSTTDFSVELFKHSYKKGQNSLISPTSVYLALGMTANGADETTLKELETLLGNGSIGIKDLNSYYNTLTDKLTSVKEGKVSIANSIWYRDSNNLNVNKDFLQTNADYYNASAYKADFNDPRTVEDINNWVKNNTGKQIDKMVDKIDKNTMMYLINAMYFESQWKEPYENFQVREGTFELINGKKKSVDFMGSTEHIYIKDDKTEGFMKPYKNSKYSFLALLPNKEINIDSYISSLSGESFQKLLSNQSNEPVSVALPKFKTNYEIKLADSLKQMSLKDCFDTEKANFNKMSSNVKKLYISDILHKTSIIVAEEGTKASAATKVEIGLGCSTPPIERKITLNRPFVYAIIDNETKLPIFIGVMMNPEN